MDHFSEQDLDHLADALAGRGWMVWPLAVPGELGRALAEECRARLARGELKAAGIGRGGASRLNEDIRRDAIQWLEPGQQALTDRYLTLMDGLRQGLNRRLYLGLEDFECHFAAYAPGAFYQKHVDRFRDDDRRSVTAILYLNEGWQAGDGGALRFYPQDETPREVPPELGTLVVFLSAGLVHEVLPAGRERLSLTGWFRRRADGPL